MNKREALVKEAGDELRAFCAAVSKIVLEQYGHEDGGDLCWSLLEMGVIGHTASHDTAARIVAQHMEQA